MRLASVANGCGGVNGDVETLGAATSGREKPRFDGDEQCPIIVALDAAIVAWNSRQSVPVLEIMLETATEPQTKSSR